MATAGEFDRAAALPAQAGPLPSAGRERGGRLRESHRVGNRPDIPYATLGLACGAADTGDWRRAAVLHGFADAFLASSGEPWQDPEDRFREQSLDAVRAHLGDADFEAEYGTGTGLDLRSAVDLALNMELTAGP